MSARFPVVTICGSMRFYGHMLEQAHLLTTEGRIVLMPFVTKFVTNDAEANAEMLDEMHRRKIDLSDSILVVTGGTGYVGPSTRGEIEYALRNGKAIAWDELES